MGSGRTAGNLFRVTKGAPPAHPLDECTFLSLRQTEAAAREPRPPARKILRPAGRMEDQANRTPPMTRSVRFWPNEAPVFPRNSVSAPSCLRRGGKGGCQPHDRFEPSSSVCLLFLPVINLPQMKFSFQAARSRTSALFGSEA